LRTAAFGDLQPDLIAGQEAEAARDGIDQRRIIARDDAEMVADAVSNTRRQLHLDMAGRPVGTIGARLVLQLGIDQHLHRCDAPLCDEHVDGRGRHRLDRIERRVVGAAGEAGIDAQFLHRRGRGLREPFLELAVEIAAGIALAAGVKTARAMCRQLLVDRARHGLIGRGPVAVAAAEHGVADLGERILRQAAVQPFDELRGVIRSGAVVRGAEDQQGALLRQLADIIIKRTELGRKAVDLGKVSHPRRQFFCRAEVGAVEHQ
jgi:hypothetical protein